MFQSFDALKGFREILREQEKITVPPKILSEYDLEELDYKVKQIQVGMMIRIVYYENGQYIQLDGKVSKLNFDTKIIQLVKTKLDLKKIVGLSRKVCK